MPWSPSSRLLRLEEELSEVHLRLATVTIENLPWHEFIKRYDRPRTLFYLDPTYYKAPFYEHNPSLKIISKWLRYSPISGPNSF